MEAEKRKKEEAEERAKQKAEDDARRKKEEVEAEEELRREAEQRGEILPPRKSRFVSCGQIGSSAWWFLI